jgi:ribosomal protein L11 methyltransferase
LAIAGKLLGAGEVKAFDFDAKAVEVASQNMERNQISGIEIFEADVFEWENSKKFQVVAANLFSTVLVGALPLMTKWIERKGRLILSGILAEQWQEVLVKAEKCGFQLVSDKKIGKWMTASFDAP